MCMACDKRWTINIFYSKRVACTKYRSIFILKSARMIDFTGMILLHWNKMWCRIDFRKAAEVSLYAHEVYKKEKDRNERAILKVSMQVIWY